MKSVVRDEQTVVSLGAWDNIGVHPTPQALVRYFADKVADEVAKKQYGTVVRIADACAGDGRLGHAVARRLLALGYEPEVCFIETRQNQKIKAGRAYRTWVVNTDFFSDSEIEIAQVVVSNPPYLTLSKREAETLGLPWQQVLMAGRNLYGAALMRCIDICAPNGVIGFLAPHGWLTNQGTTKLRSLANRSLSSIEINAFSSRRLFPGVNQDVSVQILVKNGENSNAPCVATIGYDHGKKMPLEIELSTEDESASKIRIGGFVWNREQDKLAKSGRGIPVIYGGNIQSDGSFKRNARYKSREFLRASMTPKSYVYTAPCIVIKRSMRGYPGAWKLDLAVIGKRGFQFVPENHVIVIPYPKGTKVSTLHYASLKIKSFVERAHRHYGHPNVSVALIKSALSEK